MTARLRAEVSCLQQHDGWLLIDVKGDAPTLKLQSSAWPALQYLQQQAHAAPEMAAADAEAPAELAELTHLLGRYGLLEHSVLQPAVRARQLQGQWRLPNPDRLALLLSQLLLWLPGWLRGLCWYGLPLLALWFGALLWMGQSEVTPPPWWLLAWLPLSWSVHELSHAVACRLYQIPVSGMGIRWAGRLFPTPFVSTKALPLQPSASARRRVALAGPWCDLLLATLFAGWACWQPAQHWVFWLMAFQLSLLIANLSPFRDSDGVQALRQQLTDASGRLNPLFSRRLRWLRLAYAALLLLPLLAVLTLYFFRGV